MIELSIKAQLEQYFLGIDDFSVFNQAVFYVDCGGCHCDVYIDGEYSFCLHRCDYDHDLDMIPEIIDYVENRHETW